MSLQERFESKYIPEPNSGCWLWTAAVHRNGYGKFGIGRKLHLAHRVSWEIYRGEKPLGRNVLHSCDMPCCVNPDHLFLGSQYDNIKDAISKGRMPCKLSDQDVRNIRLSTESNAALGRRYDVDASVISRIKSREDRRHVRE